MKKIIVLALILILFNFLNYASSQNEHYRLGLKFSSKLKYSSSKLKLTNGGTGWMKVPLKGSEMSNQTEGTSELLGVAMYTEKNEYPSDVSEINVSWVNETNKLLLFGDMFYIQKLNGKRWESLNDSTYNFSAYLVAPFSEVKHSYNTRAYSAKLEKGTYRIVADFEINNDTNNKPYKLTRNFNVIN